MDKGRIQHFQGNKKKGILKTRVPGYFEFCKLKTCKNAMITDFYAGRS